MRLYWSTAHTKFFIVLISVQKKSWALCLAVLENTSVVHNRSECSSEYIKRQWSLEWVFWINAAAVRCWKLEPTVRIELTTCWLRISSHGYINQICKRTWVPYVSWTLFALTVVVNTTLNHLSLGILHYKWARVLWRTPTTVQSCSAHNSVFLVETFKKHRGEWRAVSASMEKQE